MFAVRFSIQEPCEPLAECVGRRYTGTSVLTSLRAVLPLEEGPPGRGLEEEVGPASCPFPV